MSIIFVFANFLSFIYSDKTNYKKKLLFFKGILWKNPEK